MENLEIIFENMPKTKLSDFIKILGISKEKVVFSHFYDKECDKDIEYDEIQDINKYYKDSNTGFVKLENCYMGILLKDCVIVLSSDKYSINIDVNFPKTSMKQSEIKKLEKILVKLLDKYNIEKVIFGYEPAIDKDMQIFTIDKYGNVAYNKPLI